MYLTPILSDLGLQILKPLKFRKKISGVLDQYVKI